MRTMRGWIEARSRICSLVALIAVASGCADDSANVGLSGSPTGDGGTLTEGTMDGPSIASEGSNMDTVDGADLEDTVDPSATTGDASADTTAASSSEGSGSDISTGSTDGDTTDASSSSGASASSSSSSEDGAGSTSSSSSDDASSSETSSSGSQGGESSSSSSEGGESSSSSSSSDEGSSSESSSTSAESSSSSDEGSTGLSSTGVVTTVFPTTDGGSSTGDFEPGFGDCGNNPPSEVCLPGEICLDSASGSVCSLQDCLPNSCPDEPPGGDAFFACFDVTGDGIDDCVIDCNGGTACPTGMTCFADFVCVWPPDGGTTGGGAEGFGDCENLPTALACLANEICGTSPSGSVCVAQACASALDCPTSPPGGTAPVRCQDVTTDGINDCWLDCTTGDVCPTDMVCYADFICVWPPDPGGGLACIDSPVTCSDPVANDCVCEGCDPANPACTLDEDCVCSDCDTDAFCGNPANCNLDGVCDPYNEGCVCADCALHPEC